MITLFSQSEFESSNSTTPLPCKCIFCDKTFFRLKKDIKRAILGTKSQINYCSYDCLYNDKKNKILVNCLNCHAEFEKKSAEIKRSPNHFCSRSCNVTYNNKHKTTGTRRSKLETYLEKQLTILYPNLRIDYNKKDAIDSELDIYIPSLKLAFELNGIFHYEPIYGSDKLNQIQNNDVSKSKACLDNKIDLCIIDSSGLKYFKPSNAQKYLDIIVNIINQRTTC
jgi:hypothetical protein